MEVDIGNVIIPGESPTAPAVGVWATMRARLAGLAASDFVRKVAETYATQIFLIGIGLATSVTVARVLGPQGRGLYAVAIALGMTGVQLGNLGLHASNTFYVARNRALLPALIGNSLAVGLGFGSTIAIACWILFQFVPRIAPVQGTLLILGLASIPLSLTYLLLENLLVGIQEVRAYNKLEVLNRVLALTLIGAIILVHRVSPSRVVVANMIAAIVIIASSYTLLMRFARLRPKLDFGLLWSHFRLGIKAYLIALFGFLLLRIDLLMVKSYLGAEQAGYYSIASSMADYILMLPAIIGFILFPRLAAVKDQAEKLAQAKKAAIGTALALIPVLGISAIAAQPIIMLLFGKAFLPAVRPFLWLVPGIFAMGVETALVQYLNSMGFPRVVVLLWFCSTLLNIALNVWAIPHFGISGASIVSTISYSLVFFGVALIIFTGKYDRADVAQAA
jgi:O-antigen/teichoic acid export membrane protein